MVIYADCLEYLSWLPENTLHAIVTDPPYGLKEYRKEQLDKRNDKSGGIWRIPPSFDGHVRSPIPRFTALNEKERRALYFFFSDWAACAINALRPGGHVFIASNAFISQLTFDALVKGGLEFRGQIIRLVQTLRGGDRPKNAEHDFPKVMSMPKGMYEPWGIFRKPLGQGQRVSDCLERYGTGGLRRAPDGSPLGDVISSNRTPRQERDVAAHPSLKPQLFMRHIVYMSLPCGTGIVADPFMGSGATISAANAIGYKSIGVELNDEYFQIAKDAIPGLANINNANDIF